MSDVPLACRPELRDPWTVAISFMPNPGPLRCSCTFMVMVFDHAIYLEGELPCPYVAYSTRRKKIATLRKEDGNRALEGDVDDDDSDNAYVPLCLVRLPTISATIPEVTNKNNLSGLLQVSAQVNVVGLRQITALLGRQGSDIQHGNYHSMGRQAIQRPATDEDHQHNYTDLGEGIVSLRFAYLPKVTRVGSGFLAGISPTLTRVTLEELPELAQIGSSFLYSCDWLEEFHLGKCPKLEVIDHTFLARTRSLQRATFEDLPSLAEVGPQWLWQCKSLKTGSIRDFPKLTVLSEVLSTCRDLTEVHLEDMPLLVAIKNYTFATNHKLVQCDIKNLPSLTEIGHGVLSRSGPLESFALQNLPQLTSIGPQLVAWGGVRSVTIENLPELTTVSSDWISECPDLKYFRISGVPKLDLVDKRWLYGCTSLCSVTFEDLPSLRRVSQEWLAGCTALESIRLAHLPCLEVISSQFLAGCIKLQEATFEDLPELCTVSESWMAECESLTQLNFTDLPKLNQFATLGFLRYVDATPERLTVTMRGEVHETLREFMKRQSEEVERKESSPTPPPKQQRAILTVPEATGSTGGIGGTTEEKKKCVLQ